MKIFSKRLRELRKEKGLTQADLASIFHKTRSTMGGYEAEDKEPDYDFLCTIAKYFHVSTDYLLGVSDIMQPHDKATVEDQILLSALRKASKRDVSIVWKLLEPYISPSEKEILLHLNQADSKTKPG